MCETAQEDLFGIPHWLSELFHENLAISTEQINCITTILKTMKANYIRLTPALFWDDSGLLLSWLDTKRMKGLALTEIMQSPVTIAKILQQ